MVVRITGEQPGRVSVQARLQIIYQDKITVAPGKLQLDGCGKGPITGNWLIAPVDGRGLRFQSRLVAISEGGQMETDANSVRIRGVDAVTLVVTADTSHVNYHDTRS